MFTDIKHECLDVVKVDVIGAVRTIDAGEQDDKIICVESSSKLKNVSKQMKKAMKFLKKYKGKKADMKIAKKLASMAEAEIMVADAHKAWEEHVTTVKVSKQQAATAATKRSNRVRVVRR